MFLGDINFRRRSAVRESVLYVRVHGTALLVAVHALVHETGVAHPMRLVALGAFTAVHDGREALTELLREEAVDDGVDAAVSRAPPLSDRNNDLKDETKKEKYRWVPVNPNMDNPNSRLIRSPLLSHLRNANLPA